MNLDKKLTRNVRPNFTSYNLPDVTLAAPKNSPNVFLPKPSFRSQIQNLNNLLSGQSVFTSKFSTSSNHGFSASAFLGHIAQVIKLSSKPQMGGVAASPIIPMWTVVENKQTIRNAPPTQNPSRLMSTDLTLVSSGPSTPDRTVRRFSTEPQPAFVRATHVHFWPVTFWKVFGKPLLVKVLGGNLNHSVSFDPLALLARRVFSFFTFNQG